MGDATGDAALDRYTALVAALLGVRTDYASARFDAEVTAALTANRLDVATARTLRWWQRASVRELEEYANGVLPVVLAAGADAGTAAVIDRETSAASWLQALDISPSPAPSTVVAAQPEPTSPEPTPLPSRVITIPDSSPQPSPHPSTHPSTHPSPHPSPQPSTHPSTRRRSATEIQQAVREALRATAAPLNASPPGRDRGDHAHSAPTA